MSEVGDPEHPENADAAEIESQLARRVVRSLDRDAISAAIVSVGLAVEPDGQYDPADDPRLEAAVRHLAQLIEDPLLAEAVVLALPRLWRRWALGEEADGIQ